MQVLNTLPVCEESNASLPRTHCMLNMLHDCRYDKSGTNYQLPLRPDGSAPKGGSSVEGASVDLPRRLCDTWAWMRWDYSGRPQRSNEQAGREYEAAVAELEALVLKGR